MEIDDIVTGLLFTEWLLNEALQDTQSGWRRANMRAALERNGRGRAHASSGNPRRNAQTPRR